MPLQDSFRKKNATSTSDLPRLTKMSAAPSREELDFALEEAQEHPGISVMLLWKTDGVDYMLSVTFRSLVEVEDGEVRWTLNKGDRADLALAWSHSTADTTLIQSLIAEAINQSAPPAVIPEDLRPTDPDAKSGSKTVTGDFPVVSASADGAMHDEPVLSDRYIILSEIGSGGMGRVYQARHKLINRIVAVKVLHEHLLTDPMSKRRFDQEAQAASALTHPNLIAVYDYGFATNGLPYLVMDFLQGQSLQDLLKEIGHLQPSRFLNIFTQCCAALDHAHKKGVLHRDVKPTNIMLLGEVKGQDFVKIVDFGIAKILPHEGSAEQQLTQTGTIFGSPYYMSPEQCQGEKTDVRSDIYSLGCVMYEALTGKVPFSGENILATLCKHVRESARPFKEQAPELTIPQELERIVFKALEIMPENRYQSFEELNQDLDRLASQSGRSVAARPIARESESELGDLLVRAGLISSKLLNAAVQVQGLLQSGAITEEEAGQLVEDARAGRESSVRLRLSGQQEPEAVTKSLGEILMQAGIVDRKQWLAALDLKRKIGLKEINKEQAVDALREGTTAGDTASGAKQASASSARAEPPPAQTARPATPPAQKPRDETANEKSAPSPGEKPDGSRQSDSVTSGSRPSLETPKPSGQPGTVSNVVKLLKNSGIITDNDISEASELSKKGMEIGKCLVSLGRIDNNTLLAAFECQSAIELERLKPEQAIIALHYCQRTRSKFVDALDELGWT